MKSSIIAGAVIFGVALSADAKDPQTIYDRLLSGGDLGELSTFVDLMNQTFSQEDLQRIFGGEGVFTLFAPTNAAFEELFAALSDEELANLQDQNSGALERLLRYHMTQGAWPMPTGALRMLDDSVAQTYREGRDLKIDEATVGERTPYRNGLVATINTVISPPEAPLPGATSLTATSHVNNLFFVKVEGVSGTFGENRYTAGQPYGPVYFVQPDQLTIEAGRSKSQSVAQWFIEQSGLNNTPPTGAVQATCLVGSDNTPSGLNFAQVVTDFNVTWWDGAEFSCPNVVFGQGSDSDHNNWWVGQVGATANNIQGGLNLSCTVSGGTAEVLVIGVSVEAPCSDDKFNIAVVD